MTSSAGQTWDQAQEAAREAWETTKAKSGQASNSGPALGHCFSAKT